MSLAWGHNYRSDARFLVRVTCCDCGENYDVPAAAQAQLVDRCSACQQVYDWMNPTPAKIEAEDKRQQFTPIKGILFGLLFSSPFWALFIYELMKGKAR